jgi:hypothetical protein
MSKCSYYACQNAATVERMNVPDGETYRYCNDHDPMDDPVVADYFEEVDET